MIKYVVRRLLLIIPTLIGVVFIVFSITSLTPGDPGRLILGITASQDAVDRLNRDLGADRPFFERFFDYLFNLLQGDFGTSYRTRKGVVEEMLVRLPFTVRLGLMSMALSSTIGISLGILSAVKQYSLADTMSTVLAMLFASIPGFWFGMMLIYVFALQLGLVPVFGIEKASGYILPVLTIGLIGSPALLRLTRTTMLETIRQDYIKTARAKGAPERTVVWKHALKNAIIPVITVLGMSFGGLLGGAIITETVFAIPGLGLHILNAIRMKDMPVVLSSTIILSAFFCLVMVCVDILYGVFDPRIRARMSR